MNFEPQGPSTAGKPRSDASLYAPAVPPSRLELAPDVQAALGALRRKIKRYVWMQGLARVATCLALAFWISLALDWFFEPPPAVRVAVLAVAGAALGWVLVEMILRRAFVRLSDRSMAILLERYFPQFNESLVTAVELTDGGRGQAAGGGDRFFEAGSEYSVLGTQDSAPSKRAASPAATLSPLPSHASTIHAAMLAETCRLAAEPIGRVDLRRVFNFAPLRRSLAAAVLLAATIGLFAFFCPEAISVWTRRSLLMADELWPRKTRLAVEGFADGKAKVARGADLTVVATADVTMPLVPSVVKIRYQTAGGSRRQEIMAREGTVEPDKDPFQEYSYTFRGVLTPIRFDVFGGDDAVRDLEVEVVDNPTILDMELDCRFPAYMQREPRTLPVAGAMPVPVGSRVTVNARANKDLERVEIAVAGDETSETVAVLDLADRSDPRAIVHTIDDLRENATLLFTLHDCDGIRSREPMRLTLVAVADEPPELAVRLRGIGTAITPQAMLPAAGRVSDDHGLDRIWFEHALDDAGPEETAITSPPGNPTEIAIDRILDCRDFLPQEVSPGRRLLVAVKAADRYDLTGEANVGTSERWLLDVVTREQLRTMLESRELVLRQRFEAILADVKQTRSLLAGIQFSIPSAAEDEAPRAGAEQAAREGAEPGDAADDVEPPSRERLLGLGTLQVERTIQNSRKDAHEVLSVAVGFEGIREELINNRIDTEELKSRLKEGIADPLRRIVDEKYPQLDRRLSDLLKNLDDEAAAVRQRALALTRIDAILAEMNAVLARMIELEDFNEAIALLREIIEAQEELNRRTEQVHKEKLRGLLED